MYYTEREREKGKGEREGEREIETLRKIYRHGDKDRDIHTWSHGTWNSQ